MKRLSHLLQKRSTLKKHVYHHGRAHLCGVRLKGCPIYARKRSEEAEVKGYNPGTAGFDLAIGFQNTDFDDSYGKFTIVKKEEDL